MKKIILFALFAFSSFVYSQCNILYVTPTGTGLGTIANPASLSGALFLVTTTNARVIRMAIGTYNIDNAITIPIDGVTLEGGFDPGNAWRKTSLAGATTITRSTAAPEGAANAQRLVAIYAINRSNFRLQDITITTANATGNGMSTYGVHLTNCSNYNIVRCQILPGAGSAGSGDDNPATYNSAWDGANGSNGGNGVTGGGPQCTCSLGTDNGGAGGAGGTAGAGGANAAPIGGSATNGNNGGAGGAGRPDNTSANGFPGTAGAGISPGAGGAGGPQDFNGNSTSAVGNGGVGGAGTAGTAGTTGIASHIGGFFVPGAGTNGTSGSGGSGGGGGGGAGRDTDGCDAAGGGGSGGGGGGGGGGAARGGFGGGGSFGLYLFNNGANGNVIQCRILSGAAGTAGLGGRGGNGGNGGTSAIGNGCTNGDTDGNRGGSGGIGGAGGAGGNGGNGSVGVSTNIHVNGGTGLVTNDNNFNLVAQPTIFMQNTNCTYENVQFSTGAPAAWDFDVVTTFATPGTAGATSPVTTQYSQAGRYSVSMGANNYLGFAYISCSRSTSTMSPVACSNYLSPSGLYNYTTTGSYSDTITNAQGCDSVIAINLTIMGTNPLTWNGGASTTVWGTMANWNNCGTPVCAVDAIIAPAAFQPSLPAGTYSVRNLTINTGATLTVQNGATLQICGSFTNNGTIVCQTGSTIEFTGTGVQNVSDAGAIDPFHHLTITKPSGSVIINNNIVVNGDFTTTNNTSVFNSNGLSFTLEGNFNNYNGNTTFQNTLSTGQFIFTGNNAQTYNQGLSQVDLNSVQVSKSGGGISLLSYMYIKPFSGSLQLNNGIVTTNTNYVQIANSGLFSLSGGSNISYINGNLRRSVLPSGGSYNFPVGNATWYELMNINLLGTNTYTQLNVRYDNWPSGPNTLGLSECMTTYNLPTENHGYWTVDQIGGNTGLYNATLYCVGATNTIGASGWTIQKSTSVAGPWILSGTCDMTSTAAVVRRNGMSGFSVLAAAQSTTPLPVELLSFDGNAIGTQNHLYWSTATEINNQYFVIEKSNDGIIYEDFVQLNGAGNSNTVLNYQTIDDRPYSVTYYKLRQIDFDGNTKTYGPITIQNDELGDFSFISVYPNPTREHFNMMLSSKNEVEAQYYINDAMSKNVQSGRFKVNGFTSMPIQTDHWKSGMYFVKVICESYHYERTIKVVID